MKPAARIALVGIVVMGGAMCTAIPLGDGPRRVAVGEITENVIVPTYDRCVATAADLREAVQAFAAEPTEDTLMATQAAWRAARVPWTESAGFAFGPAMDLRLISQIDRSPVAPDKIDEELEGSAPLTPDYVAGLGANRKGFHAIEYLLFRSDGDDAAILTAFTAAAGAPRRRSYLVGLATALESDITVLRDAWTAGDSPYRETMTDPGSDNPTYPTVESAVDTMVNEILYLAEAIADQRIGRPLGLASGGTPQPDLAESTPSDNSIADIVGQLESIAGVYTGRLEPDLSSPSRSGIGALVLAQSPVTDSHVRAALAAALAAADAIPRPFSAALVAHPDEVQAAYDAAKELKEILATEVVTTLGATLKFNENDGD